MKLLKFIKVSIKKVIYFIKKMWANDLTTSHADDVYLFIKHICISNINKLIFGYLNINSLRNKFDHLRAYS